MKALRGWGGVARTSLDSPQEPHCRDEVEGPSQVQDKVPRCELGGLQPRTRSRRCCMKTLLGGRTSRDPPQEPHYRDEVEGPSHVQDEVPRCELAGV